VLAALVLTGAYAWYQAQSIVDEFQAGNKAGVIHAVEPELDVAPAKPTPGLGKATTFLVIGADRRAGESARGRSDTTILMRLDPIHHSVSLLSIPRDLRVPIPGHGEDKINAAYSWGGEALLIRTIREYFGIKINHFLEVDFHGFTNLVRKLGGVYIPVDGRYYHVNDGTTAGNWSAINIKPGYQKLGPQDALAFVRFRHLDTDFTRAARQQLFLREVGRELRAEDEDLTALPSLLRAFAQASTSDIHSVTQAFGLANAFRQIPSDRIIRVTLPATGTMLNGVYYGISTPSQVHQALIRWSHPTEKQDPVGVKQRHRQRKPSTPAQLVGDGGRGRQLIGSLRGLHRCAPTQLPPGFHWPPADAARRYSLNGHTTVAASATRGSGSSILWMQTKWQNPPILAGWTKKVVTGGREYRLYYDSGKLRQIAWSLHGVMIWITNTLTNELSAKTLLALARTCQPIA
jgi:LCP family protein required for cell wall assembly